MSYPTPFGKYLLLERINVGGMAEVFKAKAFGVEGFERILAIKRILPNMADDDEFINMFIDEARIAVQLSHANIVQIYELGKFENQYYIAMEYVAGKDLRQILDRFRKRKETLPVAAAAYITSKICEGLDYAHRKTDASGKPLNLIHRDVSPQNMLVSYEGAVKITDFGIVKAEDRESKTQAGVLKGKFGYMSPEQVRGLEIDNRSDLFAVGILLYEMVTGKRLFIGESDFSTLERVRNADVTPPTEHNPLIPGPLEAVMLKALAKERDERYQNAADLADALQQFLVEENTIFTGKRLAGVLQAEYRDEIAAEMQKMEEFLRIQAPQVPQTQAEPQSLRAAPTGDWQLGAGRSEKTVIFESGFTPAAAGTASGAHGMPMLPTAQPSGVPTLEVAKAAPRRTWRKKLAFGGALAALGVALLATLIYLFAPPTNTEIVVVTSSPTDAVSLYMDGLLIGEKTPLIRAGVPIGEHTLLARAAGYADKLYRFDLVAGAAAQIKVDLGEPKHAADLEVTSDPAGASVRLGGLPQGATPAVIKNIDSSHPPALEVSKEGFVTQTLDLSFAADERKKTMHVRLLPEGGKAPDGVEPARLVVRSKPEHASVYVAGVHRGETPLELTDLDPSQTYALEVAKENFRSHEEVVKFDAKGHATVDVRLVMEKHRGAPCAGTGGKVSIMPVGLADCTVMVGKQNLGVAPVFKKDCPVGRCSIDVACPGGKRYQAMRLLRANVEEKIIIKPTDWH